MDTKQLCAAISGILAILAYVPYIRGIYKKDLIPEKGSWLAWWMLDVAGAISLLAQSALTLQMAAICLGSTVVNAMAQFHGKPGWTRLDKGCIALSIIGILGWVGSGNPTWGTLSFVLGNLAGLIPTLKAGWEKPETQKNEAWWINGIGSGFAMVAVPAWSFAHLAAPLTFLSMNAAMLLVLYRPRARRA